MTIRFAAATFEPHVDTVFRVATNAGDFPIRLSEVSSVRRGRFDSFALLFEGPPSPILEQEQHLLQHDVLGDFELFIGPVTGSNAERTLYEAVFSVPPEAVPDR